MAEIKLPKLPDRTPVKLAISVMPDLKQALDDYAEYYQHAYKQTETIADLVPAIVGAFLENDRAFLKWRRQLADPDG